MDGYRHSPRTRRVLTHLAHGLLPPALARADRASSGTGASARPGADAVVDAVEAAMRALPGAVRAALVAGLSAYELGALARYGRRASRLDRDRSARWLGAWQRGIAVQREFIAGVRGLLCLAYYGLPQVEAELGYTPASWIETVRRRRLESYRDDIERHAADTLAPAPLRVVRPDRRAENRSDLSAQVRFLHGLDPRPGSRRPPGVSVGADLGGDTTLDCDVVVVGSGAGGATMAAELAEAGVDVLVLEEGPYRDTADFTPDAGAMIRAMYRDGGATMALGQPRVLYQEGRVVGGSTVINGGMAWRTPERVLEHWARDHRVEAIDARAMEPYFERVERRIHVGYQDPETIGLDNQLLATGARALGWKVIPNLRNQVHCAGSNNCAFGCPTGAKQSALVSYLPRALAYGARVQADVRVARVTRAGKRATGVEGHVLGPDGRPRARVRVRAKLVVAACGAIHTPALLRRSGLRSPSRAIGRRLTMHPNGKLVAVFDREVRGWEGVHQAFQVREFEDQGLLFAAVNVPPGIVAMGVPDTGAALGELMSDYARMVVAGVLVEDRDSRGRVMVDPLGQPRVLYQLGPGDAARLVQGTARLCELLFAAGARRVHLPFRGAPVVADPDQVARVVAGPIAPADIELFTVHMMGTAGMGGDRAGAVTDSFGRVYDTERLVVSDASLFPGPVGVNPCETIQALATRNAARLLDDHRRLLS
ncbi:GMC family oxidoreductase N-terminal domain-containing protein [Haliangium sp.]|uniref:GMC family oxidoreductase N-terminal domain-containing protein n=1 Tax=Haliangium sp. TaxID=2663208 RepID=UPI003D0A1D04